MLILSLLIFTSVLCLLGGAWLLAMPSRSRRRLQALTRPAQESRWDETILRIAQPLARLSAPKEGWADSALRRRFFHAGIRREDARHFYFGAKTGLPLLLGGLAYALAGPGLQQPLDLLFVITLAATIGCYLPNLVLHLAVRSRQQDIVEHLPGAVDLLLVCIEAGLGMDAALAKVTEEISGHSAALGQELHLTALEIRAGAPREQALRNLATRTGLEELQQLGLMLTQAERFGTSIGDSLRVYCDDLRHQRQVQAEERAAKVPTKMLFPLVFCIFPAIIAVVLGPAAIQIIRTVMPSVSGGG